MALSNYEKYPNYRNLRASYPEIILRGSRKIKKKIHFLKVSPGPYYIKIFDINYDFKIYFLY